jgi:hypothetical protein
MLRQTCLFEILEELLIVIWPLKALLLVGAYCAFEKARQLPAVEVLPYNDDGLLDR